MSCPFRRIRALGSKLALFAVIILSLTALCASRTFAQQATAPATTAAPASKADAAVFDAASDEVLAQMSEITGLALRSPLKKSLRSREQIRAHIIKEMNDDKDAAERYAGARSAEAFGLLPKGFDLDSFMIDLLTEQIAGLYDPKAHEFYVADWIPVDDDQQRVVMAHELTHALEDQHFQIETWAKAARPNDDAELARESVLEGSAMVAMVEYILHGSGRSLQDLPDIDPAMLIGDMANTPFLKKAPPFIKDALVFPYIDGLTFSATILKPSGWEALAGIFTKPPASTQQIMHPALYSAGKVPAPVSLPSMEKALGADWSKLEENVMGEFGWKEVFEAIFGRAARQDFVGGMGRRPLCRLRGKAEQASLADHPRATGQPGAGRAFFSGNIRKRWRKSTKKGAIFFASRTSFPSTPRMAESSCAVLKTNASLWKEAVALSFSSSTRK